MSNTLTEIDPLVVYFTFSHIRPRFSCGRTIDETFQQIKNNEISFEKDIPSLLVYYDSQQNYYSMNNRRLYLLKKLKNENILTGNVKVRLKPLPDTKRMREKYTPEKCSLQAVLKREKMKNDNNNSESDKESEEEEDEIEKEVIPTKKEEKKKILETNNNNNSNNKEVSQTQLKKQKRMNKKNKNNENDDNNKGKVKSLEDELNELGL